MARPTQVYCNTAALLHNLSHVQRCAPNQKIMAMVKANAYGCGIEQVVPTLDGHVDLFGVASFEEAMALRRLGINTPCVLLQGVFSPEEIPLAASAGFQCVIHHRQQLAWLIESHLTESIRVWIKVDTGMHRLGFHPHEVADVVAAVIACPWTESDIGLMTHFACADDVNHPANEVQLQHFNQLDLSQVNQSNKKEFKLTRSLANSAAILSMPDAHADIVRPGIMLYGVSPFSPQVGTDLGLIPVMRLVSEITAIHHYPSHQPVGYAGAWSSDKPSIIGVVPVGYADGYPRHIQPQTPTWINESRVPIVGRVSMDMLTVDLTACPNAKIGDSVELWGENIPVEVIAESAGTIAYELITKITSRPRHAGYG